MSKQSEVADAIRAIPYGLGLCTISHAKGDNGSVDLTSSKYAESGITNSPENASIEDCAFRGIYDLSVDLNIQGLVNQYQL